MIPIRERIRTDRIGGRAYNALRRNGIEFVDQVQLKSDRELLAFAHFGQVSLRKVRDAYGRAVKRNRPEWVASGD